MKFSDYLTAERGEFKNNEIVKKQKSDSEFRLLSILAAFAASLSLSRQSAKTANVQKKVMILASVCLAAWRFSFHVNTQKNYY